VAQDLGWGAPLGGAPCVGEFALGTWDKMRQLRRLFDERLSWADCLSGFALDSLVEEAGFEPSVPRDATWV
jgi:hypothetical protein